MTVDLNTCIEGQKLWLRNGQVISYAKRICCADGSYYHAALHNGRVLTYTNKGSYLSDGKEDIRDVIEILPLKTTELSKTASHPSVAWWDSCPWITDRIPTKEDGDHLGQVIMQTVSKQGRKLDLSFMQWNYVLLGRAWIHSLDWQPPVLSSKEKASELLAKHKDSSTMGVWVPTPEQWNIIRAGLED